MEFTAFVREMEDLPVVLRMVLIPIRMRPDENHEFRINFWPFIEGPPQLVIKYDRTVRNISIYLGANLPKKYMPRKYEMWIDVVASAGNVDVYGAAGYFCDPLGEDIIVEVRFEKVPADIDYDTFRKIIEKAFDAYRRIVEELKIMGAIEVK